MVRCRVLVVTVLGISTGGTAAAQTVERLTLVGPANEVIAVVEGEPSRVAIDADTDTLLLRPGAAIRLVHNHPSGVGLSAADLVQLAKPGVAAIVAHGSDGSLYEAARGPRYDPDRFESSQFATAHAHIVKGLLAARAHEPSLPTLDGQIAHLTSLALDRAGVIRYTATLAGQRAIEWNGHRLVVGSVVSAAAARVTELRAADDNGR